MSKKIKWIIILSSSAWVIIMVTFLILGETIYKGKDVPVLPPDEIVNADRTLNWESDSAGPETDVELENVENAEQTVARFLQHVNQGSYGDAAGLVEPNTLIDYTSENKDIPVNQAVTQFVKLFDPGAAAKITIGERTWDGYYHSVKAYVKYPKGQDTFTFSLREYADHEHSTNVAYWYIIKIE